MPLCQGRGKTDCAECAHCVHQRFEAGSSYCYYGSHFNRQINQCFRKLNIGEGSAYRRYPVSQHRAFQHRCFYNCDNSARFDFVYGAMGTHHSLWLQTKQHLAPCDGREEFYSQTTKMFASKNLCGVSFSPSLPYFFSSYTNCKWVKRPMY